MLKNKDKKEDEKLKFSEILSTIAIGLLIAIISMAFVRVSKVVGHSMDNTLYDGERLLLSTSLYKHSEPKHGDIVVVERPDLSVRYFIKRIVAVEGDTISIKNNTVYLNGEALQEDYIKEPMFTEDFKEIIIPEGKVFVMGDNRNNSLDSRSYTIGLVDLKEELVGKAIFSLSDFKFMN